MEVLLDSDGSMHTAPRRHSIAGKPSKRERERERERSS